MAPTHETDSAGLGELLRRARERRGLTLEQISKETKISRRHLEALEHDGLTGVPDGFYRRAEICAYARAVKLDQNLALAQLERPVEPPVTHEAVPETPRTQEPTLSRKRLLIVIGVVVGAAVFGRATVGREQTETPPDAVIGTPQRAQLDHVAPRSAPSEGAPAPAVEPTGARASADSVTELVVTTEPAGARVTVNGIGWGIAPVAIRYLPAGDKRVRVSKEGYATDERVVRLAESRLMMLDIRLREAP